MLDDVTIIQMIGNGAFPILITIYLLQRFEKKIEKLELAIHELIRAIEVTEVKVSLEKHSPKTR